jgi:hypothetical protein
VYVSNLLPLYADTNVMRVHAVHGNVLFLVSFQHSGICLRAVPVFLLRYEFTASEAVMLHLVKLFRMSQKEYDTWPLASTAYTHKIPISTSKGQEF